MKGIVFTEFLEMVEAQFGLDTVDAIIENSDLPSRGAYTAVGTDMEKMGKAISSQFNKRDLRHVFIVSEDFIPTVKWPPLRVKTNANCTTKPWP